MNWFLIAVVVGSVSAGIPGYWEPVDGFDDKCIMCGDPVVRTYEGTYLVMTEATKTLMTQFHYQIEDDCKFEVDCVTAFTFYLDNATEPLWADWCGVSFWTHKNEERFFRNWLLHQNLFCIGQRGQMFKGPMAINLTTYDPLTFPNKTEDPSTWNGVNAPPDGCEPYIVFSNFVDKISIRSSSDPACGCGWAVDWYPCGRDTCIVIWSDHWKRAERTGQMEGICGPMNGTANDWQTCHVDAAAPPSVPVAKGPGAFPIISISCEHGTHDGQGYLGGTRGFNFCGIPDPWPCQE